jgi:hypothetical protein
LSDLNIKAMVRDERNPGLPLKATFQGELRPEQTRWHRKSRWPTKFSAHESACGAISLAAESTQGSIQLARRSMLFTDGC